MKIMKHIEHVQFIVVFFHVSENFRYVNCICICAGSENLRMQFCRSGQAWTRNPCSGKLFSGEVSAKIQKKVVFLFSAESCFRVSLNLRVIFLVFMYLYLCIPMFQKLENAILQNRPFCCNAMVNGCRFTLSNGKRLSAHDRDYTSPK